MTKPEFEQLTIGSVFMYEGRAFLKISEDDAAPLILGDDQDELMRNCQLSSNHVN